MLRDITLGQYYPAGKTVCHNDLYDCPVQFPGNTGLCIDYRDVNLYD